MSARPANIVHYSDCQQPDDAHYAGSDELLSIGAPVGRATGLVKIGVHVETLPPGRRTSWPHAESTEEEFVYVVQGAPDVWQDGHLYRLKPGDAVGYPAGTGIAHAFLNNTDAVVILLVVGDAHRADNRCVYPLHPGRNEEIGKKGFLWSDAPKRALGSHDGLPDAQRDQA